MDESRKNREFVNSRRADGGVIPSRVYFAVADVALVRCSLFDSICVQPVPTLRIGVLMSL